MSDLLLDMSSEMINNGPHEEIDIQILSIYQHSNHKLFHRTISNNIYGSCVDIYCQNLLCVQFGTEISQLVFYSIIKLDNFCTNCIVPSLCNVRYFVKWQFQNFWKDSDDFHFFFYVIKPFFSSISRDCRDLGLTIT